MSFSDLIHKVEADVSAVLLPTDSPSDTREADALAKAAEGVALSVDPELSPMFDRLGVLGDYIEQALNELGTVAGAIKSTIAKRAISVPAPATPEAVTSEESTQASDSETGSSDPSTEGTPSDPAPLDTGASMSDATPAAEEAFPASTPPPA